MKVLLREVSTKRFYAGVRQWSREAETAEDFRAIESAEQYAAREGTVGFEMVLFFEDPRCELALPLAPVRECRDVPSPKGFNGAERLA